ncbi:MAG: hypothetical protein KIS87_02500 [Phycisphaeraceae bacterium]|nr:hypothetical protein [Phycisphaeraceae bacterium]
MPEVALELAPELIPELPPPELPLEEPPLELMPELDMPLEPAPELLPALLDADDWLGIESVVPLDADGLPGPDEREYRESFVVTHVRVGVPLGPVV